jgi:hypothetical protein
MLTYPNDGKGAHREEGKGQVHTWVNTNVGSSASLEWILGALTSGAQAPSLPKEAPHQGTPTFWVPSPRTHLPGD